MAEKTCDCVGCEAPAKPYWWRPLKEVVQTWLCDECAALNRDLDLLLDGPEDEDEDREDDGLCTYCHGSGGGGCSASICYACRGTGHD